MNNKQPDLQDVHALNMGFITFNCSCNRQYNGVKSSETFRLPSVSGPTSNKRAVHPKNPREAASKFQIPNSKFQIPNSKFLIPRDDKTEKQQNNIIIIIK